MTGRLDFTQLIAFIANAMMLLVATSTGQLHIAAALGKRAIGLYPSIRPMHPDVGHLWDYKAAYLHLKKSVWIAKP